MRSRDGSHDSAVSARPASAEPHEQVRSFGSVSMILKIALLHPLVVVGENFDHLGVRDGFDPALPFEAHVVVGDQRDVDVAHLEFAREIATPGSWSC